MRSSWAQANLNGRWAQASCAWSRAFAHGNESTNEISEGGAVQLWEIEIREKKES